MCVLYVLYVLFFFSLTACSSVDQRPSGTEKKPTQEKTLDEIIFEEMKTITNKFSSNKNPNVSIKILEVKSTYWKEPKCPAYINHKFNTVTWKYFPQISIVDTNYSCTVEILLFERLGKPNITTCIYNNKNHLLFSKDYILAENEFISPEYLSFSQTSQQKKKSAFLKLEYRAEGFNEISKEYWSGRSKIDVSYYPKDFECYINNKLYKPDADKVFFNEPVVPGKYSVALSFRGGVWDKSTKEERTVTGKMDKSFEVVLNENETKNIYITFSYG